MYSMDDDPSMHDTPRIKYIVINPDGKYREVHNVLTLDTLLATLGGYVNAIRLPAAVGQTDAYMYVAEEGKAMGLPINVVATRLAQPGVGIFANDYIVGKVILVGPPVKEEETSIGSDWIDTLRRAGGAPADMFV